MYGLKATAIFFAGAAVLAWVQSAAAGDLGDSYDWTGFHIGVTGGYGWEQQGDLGTFPLVGNVGELNLNGLVGGAEVGYDHQIENIVIGVAADLQGTSNTTTDLNGGVVAKNSNNYFGTLRGRVGYAFDNTLVYATAGLAGANTDYKVGHAFLPPVTGNYSEWGYTIGGGIEYAAAEQISLKLEYLYSQFGDDRLTAFGVPVKLSPDLHTVRFGVNFRF